MYFCSANIPLFNDDNTAWEYYNRCLLCFYLYSGNPELVNITRSIKVYHDSEYKYCVSENPNMVGCGCVYKNRIYLKDEQPYINTCLILLHEIAHFYFNISDDDSADQWAEMNRPLCCPYHY
jgi:hypothetical protein